MAHEIPVHLSTDMHDFEKYSRGATKHTRVTRTRALSLNRAVPYVHMQKHYNFCNTEGDKPTLLSSPPPLATVQLRYT